MSKTLAIIPVRYSSSRFCGKPLALISGKSLIRRTFESVALCPVLDGLYVATDDLRIHEHVKSFGGRSIMTSLSCKNGTERIREALTVDSELQEAKIIVNVQGDQPCISPSTIQAVVEILESDKKALISTAVSKISLEEARNPNVVKCVFNREQEALYFSRSLIPYPKKGGEFYYHIGIYAYRVEFFKILSKLEESELQQTEDLEQLKFLENGYKIKVAKVKEIELGVDTPEDIEKVEEFLCK